MKRPRLLIACDKFKGSFSSAEANARLSEILAPQANCHSLQVADGGEGLLAALQQLWPLTIQHVPCRDALQRWRTGRLGLHQPADGLRIFIEAADANGLQHLHPAERQPLRASSQGVGDLLRAALSCKPQQIVLGLGSSATIDGGIGCLAALGWQLFDAQDQILQGLPGDLARVQRLQPPADLNTWPEIVLLHDVSNVLLGPGGGVQVYGPQKGGSPDQLTQLESALAHWLQQLAAYRGQPLKEIPGSGAAGGLGLPLYALYKARWQAGAPWLLQQLQLSEQLAACDLLITGEGRFDTSSLQGKITGSLIQAATNAGRPVWLVCGQRDPALELPQTVTRHFELQTAGAGTTDALGDFEALAPALSAALQAFEAVSAT